MKLNSGHLPIFTLTFRLVLGIVFIYASLDKIRFPADFAIAVQNYELIPDILTNLVAIILPWLELTCGFFLITGIFLRESSGICSVLIGIFIVAILSAMLRGLDINCGCYGIDTQISWSRIIEDLGLLVMSIYVAVFPASPFAVDNIFKKNRTTPTPDAA